MPVLIAPHKQGVLGGRRGSPQGQGEKARLPCVSSYSHFLSPSLCLSVSSFPSSPSSSLRFSKATFYLFPKYLPLSSLTPLWWTTLWLTEGTECILDSMLSFRFICKEVGEQYQRVNILLAGKGGRVWHIIPRKHSPPASVFSVRSLLVAIHLIHFSGKPQNSWVLPQFSL